MQENMQDAMVDLGTACIRSGHATDQATAPCPTAFEMNNKLTVLDTSTLNHSETGDAY